MFRYVQRINKGVWFWRHNKHVILWIVRPQVPQGPSHGQEGNFVDVSRSSHWTPVTNSGSVPNYTWNPWLANYFSARFFNSSAFLLRFWFMISGQGLTSPIVWIMGILNTENNCWVTNMTDINFASSYECNGCCCSCCAGKARCSLGPFFYKELSLLDTELKVIWRDLPSSFHMAWCVCIKPSRIALSTVSSSSAQKLLELTIKSIKWSYGDRQNSITSIP